MTKGASLMRRLMDVDDPRKLGTGTSRDLVQILVIAMAAVRPDCDSVDDMIDWARKTEKWLRQFLALKNGVASEEAFLRVFRTLDAKQFEVAFRCWAAEVVGAGGVGIDGKTVRRSGSDGETAIHMASACATKLSVVRGQGNACQ
ncbi:MAG: hypothetical protein CRU78_02015 [Candidatus Accumulibacter phosphatis]|uniref:H repeat-associated protein N-terminal domain-containing protein n=1 Tax=Candidatus Accumulibacter phosphatis TaxID=327160 RepID=A0A6A7RPR6_9PROT|nr:hypothetical protein [Candidatus Accumulibacter phosphatis]